MIMSVRFCSLQDLLNVILSPSKLFISMKNHIVVMDVVMVTHSHRKCYIACGRKIISDETLSIR